MFDEWKCNRFRHPVIFTCQAARFGWDEPLVVPLSLHIRPLPNDKYPLSEFSLGKKSAASPDPKRASQRKAKRQSDERVRSKQQEEENGQGRWVISLLVNEAQDRGFVYMKRRKKAGYQVTEEETLWMHSVISTDGPNTTVYLTHAEEITSATSESSDSDWELVSVPRVAPKPQEAVTAAKQTWHVKLNLSAVGISCVDHRPREVRER